jgi:ribosomal protein S18 acetylase RimI-like enzyme
LIENGFEMSAMASFDLIKSVYESTDAFAADFEQEYSSLPALSGRLDEIRHRPGSLFLVARDEDELLGYLFIVPRLASKIRHTADLNMGVCEVARGRGVGSTLLRVAVSRLRNEGIIEIVYLMVRADNCPAIRLYEAQGFEELARLTRDTKIGARYHDGILMRLWIS